MTLPLVHHPDYVTLLPPDHRFPMPKFGRVYHHLIRDGIATLDQFHVPPVATQETLELVHTRDYVESYLTGTMDARAMRRIGFPWSPALVNRTCAALGGTLLATDLALTYGLACNTAGGTHHAFADFGSGYCIFNDLAVAARWAQHEHGMRQVLIIDLDVHQGDGTARIFQGDPSVYTFSMHCGHNFPFRKQTGDLDIELPVGMDDDAYLRLLEATLPDLLGHVRPDLVLYDAGVDPHVEDKLGKLAMSDAGLYARDGYVLAQCVGHGIPTVGVIGGGYAGDIDRLARRHCLLHRAADETFRAYRL